LRVICPGSEIVVLAWGTSGLEGTTICTSQSPEGLRSIVCTDRAEVPAPEYAAGPITKIDEGPVPENPEGPAAEYAGGPITQYHWHVTVKSAAPDCFAKDVVLVNGEFQPTIRVHQGDILQVCSDTVDLQDAISAKCMTGGTRKARGKCCSGLPNALWK